MHLSKLGRIIPAIALLGIGLGLWACSSSQNESPKDVVIKFFGAMERNERAALPRYIDLVSIMKIRDEDYSLQNDNPRVFYNPDDILDDLVDSGLTKNRWFSMQRVIGNTDIVGDSAFVEVSFINKTTNTQYYNKFGLHKVDGSWKIFSFKTLKPNN